MRKKTSLKTKEKKWKNKALTYSKEKEKLRIKVRNLERSKSTWKEKSIELRHKLNEQKRLIKKLSKKNGLHVENKGKKIKHHKYDTFEIGLCLHLRQFSNISYRSCVQVIKVLSVVLELQLFRPSINSIRNWEMKMGYNQLQQKGKPSEEWAIILDESIMVGQQVILLLLGVNLSTYKFGSALNFEDVKVLGLRIGKSCKGVDVSRAIEDLKNRDFNIKYAVCDNGNNLSKGLILSNIEKVEDCTHALGLLLQKRYEDDERFIAFSKASILFKRQIVLSKYSAFIPPVQRSKSRFLNLTELSKWSQKLLKLSKHYSKTTKNREEYEKICWIEEHEVIIKDVVNYQKIVNEILKILKRKGLNAVSKKQCEDVLRWKRVDSEFKKNIKAYLDRNLKKTNKKLKTVICCSDIIESKFGCFKNKMSSNKNVGFTAGSLGIATPHLISSDDEIKSNLENVKLEEIRKWEEENLDESILKKKKRLFKSAA